MIRIIALLLLLASSTSVYAQGTASGSISVPVTLTPTAVAPGTYTCPTLTINASGQITSAVNGTCTGGTDSGTTIIAGAGISVTGCPACVVATTFPAITKTGSYPFVSADAPRTFIYNSASPGTFSFPVAGSAGFANGWVVCLIVRGTGALTLATASPSVFYGGPVVMQHDQSSCVQSDDTGNWAVFTGVSPVITNPNTFQ